MKITRSSIFATIIVSVLSGCGDSKTLTQETATRLIRENSQDLKLVELGSWDKYFCTIPCQQSLVNGGYMVTSPTSGLYVPTGKIQHTQLRSPYFGLPLLRVEILDVAPVRQVAEQPYASASFSYKTSVETPGVDSSCDRSNGKVMMANAEFTLTTNGWRIGIRTDR